MRKKVLCLLLCLCMTAEAFASIGTASATTYEYALFPGWVVNISQGAYDSYSHGSQNAFDLIGNSNYFAPFSGTITAIKPNENAVVLQSDNPVYYANGTLDYMSVIFLHDNDISDLYIGKHLNQGDVFYQPGTKGYATGDHVHIGVRSGKDTFNNSYGTGNIYPNDALFITSSTTIVNGYGYTWRTMGSASYSYTSISAGTYYLFNTSTSSYLTVENGTDAQGQNVLMGNLSYGSNAQKFTLSSMQTYGYEFKPACSGTRILNVWGDNPSAGANMTIYTDQGNHPTQQWKFEKSGSGYIIHNMYNENLVLDTDGSNALVSNKHGGASQIWKLQTEAEIAASMCPTNVSLTTDKTSYYVGDTATFTMTAQNYKNYSFVIKRNGSNEYVLTDQTTLGQTYRFVNPGLYTAQIGAWNTGGWTESSVIYFIVGSNEAVASTEYNGSKYELYIDKLGWNAAKAKCEEKGGHLVAITSQEEYDAVFAMLLANSSATDSAWIGLSDEATEGTFEWVTGESTDYITAAKPWTEGNPDNAGTGEDYVIMLSSGKLNDLPETGSLYVGHRPGGYICEYESKSGVCGDNLTWTLEDGTLTISGTGPMWNWDWDNKAPWYTRNPQTIVIEDGVTGVGERAFAGCTALKNVTIPDSVTSIVYGVFIDCTGLESITIPDSVTSIGRLAFGNCTGLASITIPESVTNISGGAFSGCDSLTDVYYGGTRSQWSSISIGFYNDSLRSANIHYGGIVSGTCGDNLTWTLKDETLTISGTGDMWNWDAWSGNYAPWRYETITNVIISDGVTSVGDSAFFWCEELTDITIPDTVASIGEWAFYDCTGFTSITIPDGVTSIGDCAFYNCSSLSNIAFGKSVTSIGQQAFDSCTSLTSVTIPDSVTSIGSSAFSRCTGLTSVTIDCSNASICNYIFNGCNELTNVVLGDNVEELGWYPFDGWEVLKSIRVTAGNPNFCSDEYGVLLNKDKTELIYCFGGFEGVYTIPDSVTSIGDRAFRDCTGLTSITIPDSVTSIGGSAFSGCTGLTSVTIPDSVTSIGASAFNGCAGLTSVTIGNGVTSIGDSAFYGCTGLTSVTIPDSVTSIEYRAFSGCTGLTSVTIPDSVTSIDSKAFYGCTGLTSVVLPNSFVDIHVDVFSDTALYNDDSNWQNGVLYIGNYLIKAKSDISLCSIKSGIRFISGSAFSGCTGLTRVTIPNGVTNIGDRAFEDCTGLTSVTIPDSVTSIGASAFYGCTGLTSVTIPDSVTSIEICTFVNCSSLKDVSIGRNVKSIGYCAFSGCSNYADITIPDSVESIGDGAFSSTAYYNNDSNWQNDVLYIGDYLIKAKSNITSCNVKDRTRVISDSAFEYCNELTNVTIPNSVISIGSGAFYGLGLTSISIPDSVTKIGSGAFMYCRKLKSVSIGGGISSIDRYAFDECTALTDVYYNGTEEQWNSISVGANNDPLLNANVIFAAHTHTWNEGVITTPATCTGAGVKTYTCTECGETYTAAITALGHKYTTVVTVPTFTEQGYTTYTCTRCGDSYVDDYTEPLDPDAPAFTVSDATVRAGDTFTVDVNVVNNPGIVSMKVAVGYDANVLTLTAINGKNYDGVSFGPLDKNPIIINWDDVLNPNNTSDGAMATLTFTVADSAAVGSTVITLSYDPDDVYNEDYDNVAFGVASGTVEIVEYTPGDVNGDGKLNNKDLGLLKQYLNGWDVAIVEKASDVNADGKLNNKDLGLLKQYLNGWDVTLG